MGPDAAAWGPGALPYNTASGPIVIVLSVPHDVDFAWTIMISAVNGILGVFLTDDKDD